MIIYDENELINLLSNFGDGNIGVITMVDDLYGIFTLGQYSIMDKMNHIFNKLIINIIPNYYIDWNIDDFKNKLTNTAENIPADIIYVNNDNLLSTAEKTYDNDDSLLQFTSTQTDMIPISGLIGVYSLSKVKNSFNFLNYNFPFTIGRGYKEIIQDMAICGYGDFIESPYKNTWLRNTFTDKHRIYFNLLRGTNNVFIDKNRLVSSTLSDYMTDIVALSDQINYETVTCSDLTANIDNIINNNNIVYRILNIDNGRIATDLSLRSKKAILFLKDISTNDRDYLWFGFNDFEYYETYPNIGFKSIPNYEPVIITSDDTSISIEDKLKAEYIQRFKINRGL